MSETENLYDVFISYSRADEPLARALEAGLRRYRAPLLSDLKPRRLRVFRDSTDIVGNELDENLRRTLEASRNLVVLCSPAAVASHWVNREIEIFAALRGAEAVIPVLVDGLPDRLADERSEPQARAFPAALRSAMGGREPLAADFRPLRFAAVPRPSRLRSAWHHLLANIYRRTRAEIDGRERARTATNMAAAITVSCAAGIGLWQWLRISGSEASLRLSDQVRVGLASKVVERDLLLLANRALELGATPQAIEMSKLVLARLYEDQYPSIEPDPDPGRRSAVSVMAPSSGKVVVSSEFDSAAIYDLDGGPTVRLCGHFHAPTTLAFSANEKLVLGEGHQTLYAWDTETGRLLAEQPIRTQIDGKTQVLGVDEFVFGPSGSSVVTMYRSFAPLLWHLPDLRPIPVERSRNSAMVVHPRVPMALSFPVISGDERELLAWSLDTGRVLSRAKLPRASQYGFHWVLTSADGRTVVGGAKEDPNGPEQVIEFSWEDAGRIHEAAERPPSWLNGKGRAQLTGPSFWSREAAGAIGKALQTELDMVPGLSGTILLKVSDSGSFAVVAGKNRDIPLLVTVSPMAIIGELKGWGQRAQEIIIDERRRRVFAVWQSPRFTVQEPLRTQIAAWSLDGPRQLWGPIMVEDREPRFLDDARLSVQLSPDGRNLLVLPHCVEYPGGQVASNPPWCGAQVLDAANGRTNGRFAVESVAPRAGERVSVVSVSQMEQRQQIFVSTHHSVSIFDATGQQRLLHVVPDRESAAERRRVRAVLASSPDADVLLELGRRRLNACP